MSGCSDRSSGRRLLGVTGGGRSARRREGNGFHKALEGLTTSTCECAEGINRDSGAPCASKKVLDAVAIFADAVIDVDPPRDPPRTRGETILPTEDTPEARAVREAAGALGCGSESCVLSHPSLRNFFLENNIVSTSALDRDLNSRFKAKGPRNSLALLSNFNIDATLQQWARVFPGFYPCPFAMMDFDTNGDLFGSVSLPRILEGKVSADLGALGKVRSAFDCFGCVVNTDVSSGPGQHWVAVFVDCREPVWSVEYFNSAGRPPPKVMVQWMERTRADLASHYSGREVISVSVTDLDHQKSQTECGLYSLYYIRRRLENTPYGFFEENLVPDDAMTEFRKHIFRVA